MDILADFDDFNAEMEPQFDLDESSQASEDLLSQKSSKQPRRKPRRRKRMLTGVSKQRRAANERERRRLQIINNAFIGLKDLLPLLPGEENISKIEVVKLASRTILLLQEILSEDSQKRESESEESRSSCGSYSSRSCSSIESIESLDANTEFDLQDSHDFSYLLFPSDDMKLDPFGDSIDTGLSIPSPCISDSSYTSSSRESSEFPFMEDDPMRDDVFQKGPTMCLW